jgi:hypothetical protein
LHWHFFKTTNQIKHVIMVAYRQTFPNSCGASSLLAAALELGVNNIPNDPTVHPLWVGGHAIPPQGDRQSEIMLYAVTSGSPGAPTAASGYSLPSKIAKAAKALGLVTIAFVPNSITGALLMFLYGSEKLDAQVEGMLLKREAAPAPTGNQRLFRILRVGPAGKWLPATGLHYVLERPDGSIMDPAVGQNFPSLALAIQAHQADGTFYEDTGLAILIS